MLFLVVILQLDDQYLSDNREKKNETLDSYYYFKNPSKNNIETLLDENKN